MIRIRLTFVTAPALAAAATALASPALGAGSQASFALKPVTYDPALPATQSYFVLKARPGAVIERTVRIVNTGGASGTAFVYAVDGTTGQTSGAVYRSRQSPRRDVGAWISLSAGSVTLKPGQSRAIAFTVSVPSGARPGDHLGGIVAENAALTTSGTGGRLQVRIRHLTVTAVEVQIPGNAPALLHMTGVNAAGEHGYQFLYLHMRNDGAVALKPEGTVTVSTAGGKTIVSRDLRLDTFLPATEIDYPLLLPNRALPAGSYRATVRLTYGAAALGYRRQPGARRPFVGTFDFNVSRTQYAQVFQGAAPVAGATSSAGGSSAGSNSLVIVVAAFVGVVLLLGFAVLVVRRRGSDGPRTRIAGRRERTEATASAAPEVDDGMLLTKTLLEAYGGGRVAGDVVPALPVEQSLLEVPIEEPEPTVEETGVADPRPSRAAAVEHALRVAAVVNAYLEAHTDSDHGRARS